MAHWLRSYGLLLHWGLLQRRSSLPIVLLVQTGMAAGIVVGFSFLVPEIDSVTALYLTTGGMTFTLILMGMVVTPQTVSQQKTVGILDHQKTMPVPRTALLASDATMWTLVALPGLAASAGVAAVRYGIRFTFSPLLVLSVILVALCAAAIGYGVAYATTPQTTHIVTQVIVMFALMFAPVNYPADRMPEWLATAHQSLPFMYMAQVIRETVMEPPGGVSWVPFAVVAAWTCLGLAATSRLMIRRI